MELQNAKLQINLRVLHKYDQAIINILETTSHVVLYDFDTASQSWKKRGIEGSLFVYERSSRSIVTADSVQEPRYAFIILNRNGIENLQVEIIPDLQIQQSGDYLMYKLADDQVHGLWVFGDDARKKLLYQLDDCILKTQNSFVSTSENHINGAAPSNYTPQHMQHTLSSSPEVSLEDTANHIHQQHQQHQHQPGGGGVTLEEIWQSLELMAPHPLPTLSEGEFFARFSILSLNPFFHRAMFASYLESRS